MRERERERMRDSYGVDGAFQGGGEGKLLRGALSRRLDGECWCQLDITINSSRIITRFSFCFRCYQCGRGREENSVGGTVLIYLNS